MPDSLENFNQAVVTAGGVNLKEINPKLNVIKSLYYLLKTLIICFLSNLYNSTTISLALYSDIIFSKDSIETFLIVNLSKIMTKLVNLSKIYEKKKYQEKVWK